MKDELVPVAESKADPALLRRAWRALTVPGDVREVRIPKARRGGPARLFGTVSGYFDDEDLFVAAVGRIGARDAEGVYVTLNPVNPALLARAANHLENASRATTGDADVVRRSHLLIDVDPRRPAGISATDSERMAAVRVRERIEAFLRDLWGADPAYVAMTGNGGGLVYRVDLPNDPDSLALVSAVLKALAAQFDDDTASIDQSVANAARITKVIGTIAAKGDDTPSLGRRWRRATATFPADPRVVRREQLQLLAALAAPPAGPADGATEPTEDDIIGRVCNRGARSWTVSDLLERHDIAFRRVEKAYGTAYELDRCLTSTDHRDGAAIVELANGALAYRCHHNSCAERAWADVRALLGLAEREAAPSVAEATPAPDGERTASRARPILTRIADVAPESVRWLVPGRIPLGKLTVLEGDPGLGKSTLLVDLAARVTTGGAMPDGTVGDLAGPSNVIVLSAEDGAGDTIRPRLEAAGADLNRAFILEAVEEHRDRAR